MLPKETVARLVFLLTGLVAVNAYGTIIYFDDFNDRAIGPGVSPINGASLVEMGGAMTVGISNSGQGVSFAVPTNAINCFEMFVSSIAPRQPMVVGNKLTWRWVATDPMTSMQYTILESEWEKVASTTFTTRKKNPQGNTVAVHQEVSSGDLNVTPPPGQYFKAKWDRRTVNGIEQVQFELVFVDANTGNVTKYVKLFPWMDPPTFLSTRFEMTSNFPVDVVFDSVLGDTEHVSVPAMGRTGLIVLSILIVVAAIVIRRRLMFGRPLEGT